MVSSGSMDAASDTCFVGGEGGDGGDDGGGIDVTAHFAMRLFVNGWVERSGGRGCRNVVVDTKVPTKAMVAG